MLAHNHTASVHPHRARRRPAPYPALRFFGAVSFSEAGTAAEAVMSAAKRCARCHRVLAERFVRIGSTFFADDDPRVLIHAFDWSDRDACTLRLLAACIVLYGRPREEVPSLH